jgi:hypothetical protein
MVKNTKKYKEIEGEFPVRLSRPSMIYNKKDHSLLVFGGFLDDVEYSNVIYRIDLMTMKSTEIISESNCLPEGRYAHSASFEYPHMLIFGGETCYGFTNELWVFNIETKIWTQLFAKNENMVPPQSYCNSTFGEGFLYLVEGCTTGQGFEEYFLNPSEEDE